MRVIGSTKPGFSLSRKAALMFSGIMAGICYMRASFERLLKEDPSDTKKRVRGTIGSGHHSVLGHVSYNLLLTGIPKIIAMLLNNEKDYNTSEKSARYTIMRTTGEEKVIYDKWLGIFRKLIADKYPSIKPGVVKKLAQENARYFISVFTPATTMGYTVDLRQINYILGWCERLCAEESDDPFMVQLKPWVQQLHDTLYGRFNIEGLRDGKDRKFSLFATRYRREEIGENYSINYEGTFSELAQAQRHRTIDYEMMIPDLNACEFYVPPIIEDEELRAEYLADMEKLKDRYPQGMLIHINERSIIENYGLKCRERLCGAAQREICMQTRENLDVLISGEIESDCPEAAIELMWYGDKTKCQMGYACNRPCPLGPKEAYTRLI
jgi:hypothetical protein